MMDLGFIGRAILTGKIVAETGLQIGGGDSAIDIGGIDHYVIKDVVGKPTWWVSRTSPDPR